MSKEAEMHRRGMRMARRVVIKVGTPVVTHVDGNLALGRIGALVEQVARLRQEGRDVCLVTSGAISTGSLRMRRAMSLKVPLGSTMGKDKKDNEGEMNISGAAAVGQSLLINLYEVLLTKYNLSCAQVLITEDDLKDADTLSQICETTTELMKLGTIPIINDNDAVTSRSVPVYDKSTNEVMWDNDVLASQIAVNMRADLLIMLTDLDALYAESPAGRGGEPVRLSTYDPEAKLVRTGITSGQLLLSDEGRGAFANRTRMAEQSMRALVDASRNAVTGGVRAAVVTTGHHPLSLVHTLRGDDIGTLFYAEGSVPQAPLTSKL